MFEFENIIGTSITVIKDKNECSDFYSIFAMKLFSSSLIFPTTVIILKFVFILIESEII